MAAASSVLINPACDISSKTRFRRFIAATGSRQAVLEWAKRHGWTSTSQYNCLVSLWTKESGWNHRAANPYSSAYGIPQALPGSKMSTFGSDWRTNPKTQIKWGLSYIKGRYGTPCGAWSAFLRKGWY